MPCRAILEGFVSRSIPALCLLTFLPALNASQLIVNGGFETGNFNGWVVTNSSFDGTFSVTNQNVTPLTGNPTVGPNTGNYYAVSDQYGPGTYAITQTFTIPFNATSEILSFAIFVDDFQNAGGSAGEVDLLAANANPLTGIPLAIFYGPSDTSTANGQPNSYVLVSKDVTANVIPGFSYQLRVLDKDTNPLNVGVDDFSLVAGIPNSVPEPAMLFPVAIAAGLLVFLKRRL